MLPVSTSNGCFVQESEIPSHCQQCHANSLTWRESGKDIKNRLLPISVACTVETHSSQCCHVRRKPSNRDLLLDSISLSRTESMESPNTLSSRNPISLLSCSNLAMARGVLDPEFVKAFWISSIFGALTRVNTTKQSLKRTKSLMTAVPVFDALQPLSSPTRANRGSALSKVLERDLQGRSKSLSST